MAVLEWVPRLHDNSPHMSTSAQPHRPRRPRGFSLIELVIAMVIGAILVALALPSFMSSIRKGRRSEAMAALTNLQQEQERWRSNNQSYTDQLSNLRISSATTTPGGYYTLSVVSGSATATGYEAVANGTGSSQSNDGDCAVLAVKVERGSISYASCRSCNSGFSFTASNTCWAR